ncbi:MAG TPA: helix-turn-helix domain-containing protein [Nocardioides sp.]|jgi:DNA-binding MarR family transcriptional regulator|nr:helix-turn-helix domain-containing protein [Nocardioides sp.]
MADPDIGILLALAYQQFVSELHDDLGERGFDDLARSDGYVFRALAAESLTTSALAERLGISKQGAGQMVDDMTRRGYLQSRPDPTDGRARLLELSERGRAALAAAREFHRRYEQRLARRHGRAHVDTVRAVLTAMAPTYGAGALDPRLRALHV